MFPNLKIIASSYKVILRNKKKKAFDSNRVEWY